MAAATRGSSGDKVSVITAAETNQLMTREGILRRLHIPNVGTTMTVDIYDHGSSTTNKVAEYVSADGKVNWELNIPLDVGLRVVVGGTPGIVVIVWE
jgi:hypothetical protein